MKLLWIGLSLSAEEKKAILSSGGKILSGFVSQTNLTDGIDAHGADMDSINSYQRSAALGAVIPRNCWSRTGTSRDVTVSYRNIPYYSILSRTRALKKEARAWAMAHREEEVRVLVYSMHSPFMAAAVEVKKVIPTAKIFVIVPDLPQYMDMAMSRMKAALKKVDWMQISAMLPKFDGFILYSRHMAEFLKLKEGSWMVMEGSFDPNFLIEFPEKPRRDRFAVMYSGALEHRYGVPKLLEAMKLLPENVELWFTGGGKAVPDIEKAAQEDSRIKLLGFLPTIEDLLRTQHDADCLISTRDPGEEASAYCFPSKLYEYMISGNPVISTVIPGIPEEYFRYLLPLESITPEEIARRILEVSGMDPAAREALGREGRDFILREKSNISQSGRILEFIK